jgi:hypothetical protein
MCRVLGLGKWLIVIENFGASGWERAGAEVGKKTLSLTDNTGCGAQLYYIHLTYQWQIT